VKKYHVSVIIVTVFKQYFHKIEAHRLTVLLATLLRYPLLWGRVPSGSATL